ncbi:MAG: F0F1 ATP synthase subunit delta [Burkholderiaceae bacterium]
MVELSTIARPYAQAVFASAQPDQRDQWLAWLKQWAALIRHDAVLALIGNPSLTHAELLSTFISLNDAPGSEVAHNFLEALVSNGRLAALPEILRQFEALKNQADGVSDALIESAFPLDSAALNDLLPALEKKFGGRLKAAIKVDQTLIGGIRVIVGDQILDGSIRGSLNAMKTALIA